MQKILEQKINDMDGDSLVELKGKIEINIDRSSSFTVGKRCVKGIIDINRSNVIIDGLGAEIIVNVKDSFTSDWSLFFVSPAVRNVQLKNLFIKVNIDNSEDTNRLFSVVYNTSYGLKIINCNFEVISNKQINLYGIYNNGNLDTHIETRADNLTVDNCQIKVDCNAENYSNECSAYGIYNYLANSISVQNNYIYVFNRGTGLKHMSIGLYTNGRYGRFVGNNIKANGCHNVGREKERAHAIGFINEGLYSIISSNNIVGEWAGKAVGLDNYGEYAVVSSNKILATHTICGRSIRSYGNNSCIEGNVLTSTSRNARLVEHNAHNCIISRNIFDVLMTWIECRSGCGIYAVGEQCTENIITENIIRHTLNCALFLDDNVGIVKDNSFFVYEQTVHIANSKDKEMFDKLSEENITSIYL